MSREFGNPLRISFLVAAWQEANGLAAFLASYSALSHPNKELVLCAGGSDRTYELACQHNDPSIIVLRQDAGEGKQKALRKAFTVATGDVIVLTDADCFLEEAELSKLIEPLLAQAESVVNGSCKPLSTQMEMPFVMYQYAAQRKAEAKLEARAYQRSLLGRNCAIRREALESVNAFDEDVAIGTDAFLARKLLAAGYRIRFIPSRVSTAYPQSIAPYAGQRSRWWRNRILLALRSRSPRRLIDASIPIAIGLAVVTLPLLGVVVWPFFLVWIALLVFSCWSRVRAVRFLERDGIATPRGTLLQLPITIAADSYAGLLTLYHLLSPRLRTKW